MEIVIKQINIKEIKEEMNKFIEEEFENYKTLKGILSKFNNDLTISVSCIRNILVMINSYDIAFKEKNKLINLPINSALYSVNPYNNKQIFETIFDYKKIDEENIEVILKIEPINEIDKHLLFIIEAQINIFKDFLENGNDNFKETLIPTLKLNFSKAFEVVNEIMKMKKEDFERLKLNENIDLYLKEIAYCLDNYKMPELYEKVKNENN